MDSWCLYQPLRTRIKKPGTREKCSEVQCPTALGMEIKWLGMCLLLFPDFSEAVITMTWRKPWLPKQQPCHGLDLFIKQKGNDEWAFPLNWMKTSGMSIVLFENPAEMVLNVNKGIWELNRIAIQWGQSHMGLSVEGPCCLITWPPTDIIRKQTTV